MRSVCLILCALILWPSASHAGPVADELKARGATVSKPVPRPDAPAPAVPKQTEKPAPSEKDAKAASPPKANICLAALRRIAEADVTAQPDAKDAQCGIANPVILKSTRGPYPVAFSEGLTLDCAFAEQVATFVRNTAQPLARHHLTTPLLRVHSGQGFVCRRRNGAPTGKLSEHAFGAAIDLVAFETEGGKRLDVRDPGQMKPNEAAFFSALRTAACGTFTTVLGPGSDAAHATHLHLDLARSKDRENPYRICQ